MLDISLGMTLRWPWTALRVNFSEMANTILPVRGVHLIRKGLPITSADFAMPIRSRRLKMEWTRAIGTAGRP